MSLEPAKTTFFTDRGRELRGVVHVGANTGQEIPWYRHLGHTPILAFEPNPDLCSELTDALGEDGQAIMAALGDKNGHRALWIPRHLHDDTDDSQCASFLQADRTSGYDWGDRNREGRYVDVPVYRFDEWAVRHGIDLNPYNTLVVDVEGTELEVLRGLDTCLVYFEYLSIECSERPIYQGQPAASQVCDFLKGWGFERVSPIESHGDVFFERVR